jgi:hypothetical protein
MADVARVHPSNQTVSGFFEEHRGSDDPESANLHVGAVAQIHSNRTSLYMDAKPVGILPLRNRQI